MLANSGDSFSSYFEEKVCQELPLFNNEDGKRFIRNELNEQKKTFIEACCQHGWPVPSVTYCNDLLYTLEENYDALDEVTINLSNTRAKMKEMVYQTRLNQLQKQLEYLRNRSHVYQPQSDKKSQDDHIRKFPSFSSVKDSLLHSTHHSTAGQQLQYEPQNEPCIQDFTLGEDTLLYSSHHQLLQEPQNECDTIPNNSRILVVPHSNKQQIDDKENECHKSPNYSLSKSLLLHSTQQYQLDEKENQCQVIDYSLSKSLLPHPTQQQEDEKELQTDLHDLLEAKDKLFFDFYYQQLS